MRSSSLFFRRPFFRSIQTQTSDSFNRSGKPTSKIVRNILFGSVLGAYSFYQYEHYSRNVELAKRLDIPFYKVLLYKAFPFSAMSSFAGWVGSIKIESVELRRAFFGLYARAFGCNMDEARKPLESYETFSDFFSRPLKKNARKICNVNGLISACDGTLLHCGQLNVNGADPVFPEQVKGSLYEVSELIGSEASQNIKESPGKSLFYCTIYLAPGDYHRFHAPTKIRVDSIKPFSGEVLSVAPWVMKAVPKLLCMNERVAINGKWKYGHMSFVPVGAANVGSIKIKSDVNEKSVLSVGSEIGHFELGSTLVLIFEAPKDSQWIVNPGEKLKLGQPLFKVDSQRPWWYIF